MIREGSLEDISDGKLYGSRDLVKVDTNGCQGCSACCRGMGSSIILDPLDVYRLSEGTGRSFMEMLGDGTVELQVVDGMILPDIAMKQGEDCCPFLNDEGRCSVHEFRPGFCRLFPLGRYYEGDRFYYIHQTNECVKGGRRKVRVSHWLATEPLKPYEEFCMLWHQWQKRVQRVLAALPEENQKTVSMYVLRQFYLQPFDPDKDFYLQFQQRLITAGAKLGSLEAAMQE